MSNIIILQEVAQEVDGVDAKCDRAVTCVVTRAGLKCCSPEKFNFCWDLLPFITVPQKVSWRQEAQSPDLQVGRKSQWRTEEQEGGLGRNSQGREGAAQGAHCQPIGYIAYRSDQSHQRDERSIVLAGHVLPVQVVCQTAGSPVCAVQ